MSYDFDRRIDRYGTECTKWHCYDHDVLPMWVADMEFRSPEPIIRALHERVEHGVFGYAQEPPGLRDAVTAWLQRLYGWSVGPEALVFMPGVVTGFNLVCHAVGTPGEGVLMQTPVYYPILHAPSSNGLANDEMELTCGADGHYEIDFDRFERAITDRTHLFILCNPHNPVGRVFRRDELAQMAEICLRHNIVICSDEIHSDLVYPGHPHVPIASLAPEIANQTITLMAPSKTFNVPGLKCSVAVVENPELRRALKTTQTGLVHGINIMGYVGALAGYRDGRPWLEELLKYLEDNRDFLADYVATNLPGIAMSKPEGTYLAWLDCREAGIPGNAHEFFLREARVALNDGAMFGRGGEGFVRLNFGCPRSMLAEALDRMRAAFWSVRTGDTGEAQ
jgi:cystathionine beta-lyase